jgi:hypothetical protein
LLRAWLLERVGRHLVPAALALRRYPKSGDGLHRERNQSRGLAGGRRKRPSWRNIPQVLYRKAGALIPTASTWRYIMKRMAIQACVPMSIWIVVGLVARYGFAVNSAPISGIGATIEPVASDPPLTLVALLTGGASGGSRLSPPLLSWAAFLHRGLLLGADWLPT